MAGTPLEELEREILAQLAGQQPQQPAPAELRPTVSEDPAQVRSTDPAQFALEREKAAIPTAPGEPPRQLALAPEEQKAADAAMLKEMEAEALRQLRAPKTRDLPIDAQGSETSPANKLARQGADAKGNWSGFVDKAIEVGKNYAEGGSKIAAGTNTGIADFLGFAYDAPMAVLRKAGLIQQETGGSASKALREAMRTMGISAPERKEFGRLEQIGDTGLLNLFSFVVTRQLAKPFAAPPPTTAPASPLSETGRVVATDLVTKPVTNVIGSVTAAPGQVLGGQAGEDLGGNVGRVLGELAGGTATGVAGAAMARRAGLLPQGEQILQTPPLQPPIVPRDATAQRIQQFAQQQVRGELDVIDQRVQDVIRDVMAPRRGVAPTATTRERSFGLFMEQLERTYSAAMRVEDRAWRATPQNAMITPTNTLAEVQAIISDAALARRDGAIPHQKLTQLIDAITQPTQTPGGLPQAGNIPLGELLGQRSDLLRLHREAGGAPATGRQPNRLLQSVYTRLQDAILRDVDAAFPNDPTIAQAREISRNLNERFRTGPLGQVLSLDMRGADRYDPVEAFEALLKAYEGPRAIHTAADPLATSGPASNMLRTQRELTARADESIRAQYQKVVRDSFEDAQSRRAVDPRDITNPQNEAGLRAANAASQRFQREYADVWEPRIDYFTRAHQAVRDTTRELHTLMNQRHELGRSRIAAATRESPENLIVGVMAADDPVTAARELSQRLANDPLMSAQGRPAAQQAFETGLVDYFFQMHGKSAKTLREGLDSPRWGQVLQDQLGSHRYQRLNDLVDFMVPLERGEGVPLGEKAGKFAGTWLAHIAGLQIGHLAAKMFTSGSAGSLSLPMKMARVLRSQAEEFFSQSKPSQYIAMAISDPEVYQKLATRMPGGPTEALSWAKTTGSWMRRVQVGAQEGRNAMFDQLADEEEKARRGR